MAAGLAPMKRHCPSCGEPQLSEGKPLAAKITVGETPMLWMCVVCHHTWPTMDMTNRDWDTATLLMEKINTLVDAGVSVGKQALANLVDSPEYVFHRHDHG